MRSLARPALIFAVALLLGIGLALGTPDPPPAQANVACDVISGAGGLGTPTGDACDAVTDPVIDAVGGPLDPMKDAISAVRNGIFDEITSWVADGATWLLGEVAALSESTTTPNLLSKGFLRQYKQMAQIAIGMALLMVLFAVIEAAARGDGGMVVRVLLVNVPLAAIATSAAYVLVALLLNVTDELCRAISHTAKADTAKFFDAAIHGLVEAGASAGEAGEEASGAANTSPGGAKATGAVAVPLFVGFIAAILAAFAAFFVWIELLMRDAAVYAVALFMPFGLAAAIWPRWSTAFKRTAELIVVVVFSKFVIVAIIALSASMLADGEGGVEQVLSAGALLLLACFTPVMLMHFAPFAQGAIASAHSRQSAAGGMAHGVQLLSSAQMMQRTARASWGGNESTDGIKVLSRGRSGSSSSGSGTSPGSGANSAKSAKGSVASGGEAASAGASTAAAPAAPVAGAIEVAKAAKGVAGKLAGTASADLASESGGRGGASGSKSAPASGSPSSPQGGEPSPVPSQASLPGLSTETPEPTEAHGGAAYERSGAPRPAAEVKASEGSKEDRK